MVKPSVATVLGILISLLFVGLGTMPAQAASQEYVDNVVETDSPVCPVRFQL